MLIFCCIFFILSECKIIKIDCILEIRESLNLIIQTVNCCIKKVYEDLPTGTVSGISFMIFALCLTSSDMTSGQRVKRISSKRICNEKSNYRSNIDQSTCACWQKMSS